jgi:sugar/nucleoside kinase (ribokinase family)
MEQSRSALHRAIVIVDVERFCDPEWTNIHQLAVRDNLYRILRTAFFESQIDWPACETEDRGYGALILVPPVVPKIRLADALPGRLTAGLRRHNAACSPPARIRLRVCLHAGEVHPDAHGVAGDAINFAFRLVQAPALREVSADSDQELSLIVSDWFYQEVVRHDPAIEPGSFREVGVRVKETKATAWIRRPHQAGGGDPPRRSPAGHEESPIEQPVPRNGRPKNSFRAMMRPLDGSARDDVVAHIQQRLQATSARETDVMTVTAHNLDRIYQVDVIEPDHEAPMAAPSTHAGGSGANTVSALSLLGLRSAAVGVVAADEDGRVLMRALREAKVDTSNMLTVRADESAHTGHTLVFSDGDGRRTIYVDPGVNERLAGELHARGLFAKVLAALPRVRVLHLTSFVGAAERKLQEDVAAGLDPDAILSFTPGSIYARQGADRLAKILGRTNLLFLYEQQLDQLLANSSAAGVDRHGGQLAGKLEVLFEWKRRRGLTEPLVVAVKRPAKLTHGSRPADYLNVGYGRQELAEFIRAEDGSVMGPSLETRDSTGAGDALAAGLIFGLTAQRPLTECVDTAFVMAMSASSGLGARTGLPRRAQLPERWATYLSPYNAPAWLTDTLLEPSANHAERKSWPWNRDRR